MFFMLKVHSKLAQSNSLYNSRLKGNSMGGQYNSNHGTRVKPGHSLSSLGPGGAYLMLPHFADLSPKHTMLLYVAMIFVDS